MISISINTLCVGKIVLENSVEHSKNNHYVTAT